MSDLDDLAQATRRQTRRPPALPSTGLSPLAIAAIVGGAVLFLLLMTAVLRHGGPDVGGTRPATAPPARPMDIRVTSLIVKHVDGQYRYWFRIENEDDQPFRGEVEITLVNSHAPLTNGSETFATTKWAIERGGAQVVNFDAHTGPPSVHGGYSVAGYRFVARSAGQVVARGQGPISSDYEDTAVYRRR